MPRVSDFAYVRAVTRSNAPVGYPLPKKLLDKLVSGALLVLLSPVVLVVVLAYAFDVLFSARDRGPLIYREPRISRGRRFDLLKFRTLRTDVLADAAGHARLLEVDPDNLTWVGRRILKPWYLDEVPQLVNVLRGDISLVGPRPWPPELVERQVVEGRDYRNLVMAGLTGPAQVTKGEGIPYADLDLGYVELCRTLAGWALARYDLRILRRTIGVIARREGLSY
jgi:lipopolysaccharide/colanic/teichoic acid biosynthesis glycosyltransferase